MTDTFPLHLSFFSLYWESSRALFPSFEHFYHITKIYRLLYYFLRKIYCLYFEYIIILLSRSLSWHQNLSSIVVDAYSAWSVDNNLPSSFSGGKFFWPISPSIKELKKSTFSNKASKHSYIIHLKIIIMYKCLCTECTSDCDLLTLKCCVSCVLEPIFADITAPEMVKIYPKK